MDDAKAGSRSCDLWDDARFDLACLGCVLCAEGRGEAPPTARGKTRLAAYALYNTCEEAGGRCLFLRQDLMIELDVAK